nr:hypothetical protein [Tanacetum cinerariifolium]
MDACKNAKDMWERIKRLMFGSDVTSHVRHSRLMDEFDKFAAKEEESLEFVYEILTTLVNIMDRNNVFLFQCQSTPRFLVQFEPHVFASKAKKTAKNHDPLALLSYSNASSSQSHANSSYSSQPYNVTHPSYVVDYEDKYKGELQGELQGDSQEDKHITAMMLLAQEITQKFSTPTNNRLRLMIHKYRLAYTRIEVRQFRDTLIQHMESAKKSIDERVQHKREYDIRMNERQMQSTEGKVDSSKALDVDLVVTESCGTESKKHDTSSKSRNDTHAEDVNIKPANDKEPMAK